MNLTDKVVLVTGASRGIGQAIAAALVESGAYVAITGRDKQKLETVADTFGDRALPIPGDLTDDAFIPALVEQTVQHFGQLDILVNNAGIGHFFTINDMPVDKWDAMFNLNVRAVFLLTQACLPHLRNRGESFVVNVASLAAKNTFATGGAYTATKHALLAFSRCLMLEERTNGIRVLTICPGSVATRFGGKPDGDRRSTITQPEDVAASILHALQLPQRVMVSEIDMRPTNP